MTIHEWNTIGLIAASMLFVFGAFLLWVGEKAIRWRRNKEELLRTHESNPTYIQTDFLWTVHKTAHPPWYVRFDEYMTERWGGNATTNLPHL